MQGWLIFKKSITQIIYNFGDAMKLTALLWIIWQGANLLISYLLFGKYSLAQTNIYDPYVPANGAGEPDNLGAYFLAMVLILALSILIFPWIAVLWHRYMLLNEQPKSNIPTWQKGLIWRYFLKSIKVTLIIILIATPIVIFAVYSSSPKTTVSSFPISNLLLTLVVTYFSLRIALVLPAIALGNNMTIKQSWNYTKPINIPIIIASLLLGLVYFLFGLIPLNFSNQAMQNQLLIPIYGFFADWIVIMIGISILTTLYGHLVDGKEL